MTDETPAENTPPDLDAERAALTEEGRRLASQRDDLIAQGADPADLLVPIAPNDAVPFQGDDSDPVEFTGDPDGEAYDPDHQPAQPAPEPDDPEEPGDPVLIHDDQPALDDGDPNPDDMAGDLTTPDVDLDFLPTDDGDDQ